jgi:hypothetical protein
VVLKNARGPGIDAIDHGAQSVGTASRQKLRKPNLEKVQAVIRAELFGADESRAAGITVRSLSPVLSLCRALIEAGHDPAARVEVYRGNTLSLTVRSIGEGANLQINSHGTGFEPLTEQTGGGSIYEPPSKTRDCARHAELRIQKGRLVGAGGKRCGLAARWPAGSRWH